MKKKIIIFLCMIFGIFSLASCDNDVSNGGDSSNIEQEPNDSTDSSNDSVDKPNEPTPSTPTTPIVLKDTNVYVVGDSTVCDYTITDSSGNTTITDKSYFYNRFGYATQLSNYLSDKANIINLALSGRSSKSFTQENNYAILKNSIK